MRRPESVAWTDAEGFAEKGEVMKITVGAPTTAKRYKCRHSYCPNYYDDVIGQGGWGTNPKKAECVPCLYAHQLLSQGQTPQDVESIPQFIEMFNSALPPMGWTWQHVKDCYQRLAALPAEQRDEQ
jgi:hypothetical protein